MAQNVIKITFSAIFNVVLSIISEKPNIRLRFSSSAHVIQVYIELQIQRLKCNTTQLSPDHFKHDPA